MTAQDISALATPAVLSALGIVVATALNSDPAKRLLAVLTDKIDAEAAKGEAQLLQSHNILVRDITQAAMAFAEQHEKDVLTTFSSKADFVEKTVLADPRFASLSVPADSVKMMIEEIFQDFYKTIDKAPPATPAA